MTSTQPKWRFFVLVIFVVFVGLVWPWPLSPQALQRPPAPPTQTLPVELPLSEDPAKRVVALDMSLSGLPRGDYLFELTVGANGATERHLLAIRIKP